MDSLLSPIHPGEVLLEGFMQPLDLSHRRLANTIGVPPIRINQIVHGQRANKHRYFNAPGAPFWNQ